MSEEARRDPAQGEASGGASGQAVLGRFRGVVWTDAGPAVFWRGLEAEPDAVDPRNIPRSVFSYLAEPFQRFLAWARKRPYVRTVTLEVEGRERQVVSLPVTLAAKFPPPFWRVKAVPSPFGTRRIWYLAAMQGALSDGTPFLVPIPTDLIGERVPEDALEVLAQGEAPEDGALNGLVQRFRLVTVLTPEHLHRAYRSRTLHLVVRPKRTGGGRLRAGLIVGLVLGFGVLVFLLLMVAIDIR